MPKSVKYKCLKLIWNTRNRLSRIYKIICKDHLFSNSNMEALAMATCIIHNPYNLQPWRDPNQNHPWRPWRNNLCNFPSKQSQISCDHKHPLLLKINCLILRIWVILHIHMAQTLVLLGIHPWNVLMDWSCQIPFPRARIKISSSIQDRAHNDNNIY